MKWRIASAALLVIASCSSPKYTYFFDQPVGSVSQRKPVPGFDTDSLSRQAQFEFEASASPSPATTVTTPTIARAAVQRKATSDRDIRIESEQTATAKAKVKVDSDLKRSVIFAGSGIVALIIGGQVFWVLGTLSLLIGLIFGIKWLLRQ